MYGVRPTAWIMTGIMLVEAWPLALIALAPRGMAKLAMLLGYHAPPIGLLAWASGLIVALAYAALSMTSLPFIRSHVFDVAALKLLALPFAFITGLFEELFFRKWIMNALASQGSGAAVQITVSGLGFGVAHAAWGLLGGNFQAAAKSMVYTGGLGLVLGATYLLAGRQLAPCAWSHIIINLIIEPWLMLAVINLRARHA